MKMSKLPGLLLLMTAAVLLCLCCVPKAQAATYGDLTFSVSNGEVTITDCKTSARGNITIPATLSGYPVTSVDSYAFAFCDSLTSITIPNSVKSIGDLAFSNCTSLTFITIPNKVTSIGKGTFFHCTGLISVTIPDNVTSIGDSAFSGCDSLTTVTIGDNVTSIGEDAFSGCDSLTTVAIGDNVTSIGELAFYNCTNLSAVNIPDSVTSVGEDAFSECSNLKYTTYDNGKYLGNPSNPYLCLVESTSKSISSVTIHDSCRLICYNAFIRCMSLTTVTIGDSVTSIGNQAFFSCFYLTTVYYAGSQAKWNTIDIDDWNDDLTSADIQYNHAHDYTVIPPTRVEPTCTQDGSVTYTCVHGETVRQVLPALGHTAGADAVVIAPTCTEEGYTLSTCPRCGKQGKTDLTAPLGHGYTGPEKSVPPTCTQDGYAGLSCTRCDSIRPDNVLYALNHKMGYVPATEATCTSPGFTYGTKCERCDYWGIEQTQIPKLGHDFAGGVCTRCQYSNPGDFNGDEEVTDADALYLLRHSLFPERYPISEDADVNGDGEVTDADALYLLRYTLFPERYPLYPPKD